MRRWEDITRDQEQEMHLSQWSHVDAFGSTVLTTTPGMADEMSNRRIRLVSGGRIRPMALLLVGAFSFIGRTTTHPTNRMSATGFAIGDFFASPFTRLAFQPQVRLRGFDRQWINQWWALFVGAGTCWARLFEWRLSDAIVICWVWEYAWLTANWAMRSSDMGF